MGISLLYFQDGFICNLLGYFDLIVSVWQVLGTIFGLCCEQLIFPAIMFGHFVDSCVSSNYVWPFCGQLCFQQFYLANIVGRHISRVCFTQFVGSSISSNYVWLILWTVFFSAIMFG